MRVGLIVEQLLSPSPGGIGRYTTRLATLLAGTEPSDDVVPVTARHPADTLRRTLGEAGIGADPLVQPLPRPLLYDAWVRVGLPVRGLRADVLHAPSVAVPGRTRRTPLVVTLHDAAAHLFPDAFTPRGRRFHARGEASAARRADAVITVSRAAAEEITAFTAVPAERIRIVPHAVEAPATIGPAPFSDYVLWVGSLEPRKDVGTLVSAMARLASRNSSPSLVLAGFRGWLNASLVPDAARQALGDRLVVLGPVSEPELWALYRGARLLALPSRHEGFGLTAVEAMAVGTPVVASDLPVTREILGDAARLVPPGRADEWAEAIEDLLENQAEREHLSAAGRERAARYGTAQFVAATRAVYAEVTGRS